MKLTKIHPVICFRGFSWFFRKNWYAIRKGTYPMSNDTHYLIDIGAITIGFRKDA